MKKQLLLQLLFFLCFCCLLNAEEEIRWKPQIKPIGAKNLIPNASFECHYCPDVVNLAADNIL